MKEKREGGAMKRTRISRLSALSKAELSRKRNRRAFSLAEVLIVVAIIAVLVAIAIPVFRGQLEKNRDSVTATNLRAAYDEATATFLAKGKKLSDTEVKIKVDGVVFETTDKSLSGEEADLPFTFDLNDIPPKGTSTVEFVFKKDQTTRMTVGASDGIGDVTISDPVSPPPAATPKPNLVSISITTPPDKTAYTEGERFSAAGMVVTATYKNDKNETTTETVTGFTWSPSGALAAGDTNEPVTVNVIVSYNGFTATQAITVAKTEKTLVSIAIARRPNKTEYLVGDTFDPTGMKLTLYYSDESTETVEGSTETVENGYYYDKIPPFTDDDVGEKSIVIKYGDTENPKTTTLTVKVIDRRLESIEVSNAKTAYKVGDSFDTDGMTVTAKYSNGETKNVTDKITIDPDSPLTADDTEVTVSYTEGEGTNAITATATVTITVAALDSIEITDQPAKTDYKAGDTFDKAGMEVTAHYTDARFDGVVEGYTIAPTTLAKGDSKVTVSYTEGGVTKTADVDITVAYLTGITIKTDPAKTEYKAGDQFDPNGLEVTAKYSNDKEEPVSYPNPGFSFVPDTSTALTKDQTTVTVSYTEGGETATATLAIKVDYLTGIEVSVDRQYYVDEIFDEEFMTVKPKYYYSGTAEEPITSSNYTHTLMKDGATVANDAKLEKGEYTVTVTYSEGGIEITEPESFSVSEGTVERIEIISGPSKTEYYVGDTFDRTRMKVLAHYDHGDPEDVTSDCIITSECIDASDTFIRAGSFELTVSYEGKTAEGTIAVEVLDRILDHIEITTPPGKTVYVEGESFNPARMVVTAVYNNNTSEPIEDYTYTPDGELATSDTSVTIEYKEKTATQGITVNKRILKEIKITTPPTKTDYYEGEKFDPAGMVVTAYYENTTITREIEIYEYEPKHELHERDKKITVKYSEDGKEVQADQTITVTKRTIQEIKITTPPTKTEYTEGEKFNPAGMVVTVYYDHGDPDIITDTSKLEYDPKLDKKLKATNTSVKVSYGIGPDKKSDTQLITVNKEIKSIAVTKQPTNTQYQGYEFDPTGMAVTVTYKDNSFDVITDYTKLAFSPTGVLPNTGKQTMTVTYKTANTTFDITVVKSLTSIAVSGFQSPYSATDAYLGRPQQHMTVTAYYSDGTSRKLASNEYTYVTNPESPDAGDDVTVTVTSIEGQKTATGSFHINDLTAGEAIAAIFGNLCFAPGTPITLADGTQKPVEELSFDDELLVWDFNTGTFGTRPATLLINHGEDIYSVIDLRFSDGTMLRIVGEHGVFDFELNRFVYVNQENAADFIGHRFVKCAPKGEYELVTLDSVEVSEEQTEAWSVVSSGDFNVFAADLLTLSPPKEVFDLIPMGETLRYDMDLFRQLVAEYGTYDYEVYAQFATKEQYEALNGAYMKIPVEMGLLSFEELWTLFEFVLPFMN